MIIVIRYSSMLIPSIANRPSHENIQHDLHKNMCPPGGWKFLFGTLEQIWMHVIWDTDNDITDGKSIPVVSPAISTDPQLLRLLSIINYEFIELHNEHV